MVIEILHDLFFGLKSVSFDFWPIFQHISKGDRFVPVHKYLFESDGGS